MGTRGYVGIKKGNKITGFYNHMDSYYRSFGWAVVARYFDEKTILDAKDYDVANLDRDSNPEETFLTDGLFCEYGYVHNLDNDTLEIYRGFFSEPQWTKKFLESYDNKKFYTHLIFIIDRKIHTKELAITAFEAYDTDANKNKKYPEREIINICSNCFKAIKVGKMFCCKRCEMHNLAKKI